MNINKLLNNVIDVFDEEKNGTDEPVYDPLHVGAMIVLVVFSLSLLFWLLWALLVFGGGLQSKIMPFIQLLLTAKTKGDFGYIGYPYEMGVFEGWPTNVTALILAILLLIAVWYLFEKNGSNKGK